MKMIRKSISMCIVLTLLCSVIYPLIVTGISQLIFNKKANGSIIKYNGKDAGSEFLGQSFTDNRFFKGRISDNNYNGVSGSSNLAPSNKALMQRVNKALDEFLKSHPTVKKEDIPEDLLTSSASGFDPDISPSAAEIQVPLIQKTTGISKDKIENIIKNNTEGKTFGIFGEERVNVLKANLDIYSILGGK